MLLTLTVEELISIGLRLILITYVLCGIVTLLLSGISNLYERCLLRKTRKYIIDNIRYEGIEICKLGDSYYLYICEYCEPLKLNCKSELEALKILKQLIDNGISDNVIYPSNLSDIIKYADKLVYK